MTEPIYSWRESARIKGGILAQVAGEELQRIREKHDGITPAAIVDESRPTTAPLHPAFTWDDAVAAENWRRDEARHIVRSVRVQYEDSSAPEPAYVNVRRPADEEEKSFSYYENTRAVVWEFSLYESAWRAAKGAIDSAVKSMEDLERIAREQVNDQAVPRADLAESALKRLRETQQMIEAAA